MFRFLKAAAVASLVFVGHQATAASVLKQFDVVTTDNKNGQPVGLNWNFALDDDLDRTYNVSDPGLFTIFDDGTATLVGTFYNVADPNSGFVVSLQMDSDPLLPFEFKPAFDGVVAPDDPNKVAFFDPQSGTAMGFGVLDGLDFDISRYPIDGSTAFQYGGGEDRGVRGVNQHNDDFGFSVWLGAGNITSSTCVVCSNPEIADISGKMFDIIGNLEGDDTVQISAVPLPAGGVLLLTALGVMGIARRRS